jgi:hypothetical protein
MPTYDIVQFDPPAPLAKVTLRNPDSLVIQATEIRLLPQHNKVHAL